MLTYFLPDERKFILIKLLQTCRIIVEYVIEVIQTPLQRGFTEAVSSLLAACITSEVVLNGLEDNEDVLLGNDHLT